MKLWKKRLAALLMLQLALVGGIWALSKTGPSPSKTANLLSHFDRSKVDRVEITGSGQTFVMQKKAEGWRLSDYHNLPVDAAKLEGLFDQLERLEGTELVSRAPESQTRFQVSDEEPNGRIVLKAGEDRIADLLLGKNAALDKRYVRVKDTSEIYSAALGRFGLFSGLSDWFDRTLLQPGDLQSLTIGSLKLEKNADLWTAQGMKLKEQETAELLDLFRNLTVMTAEEAAEPNAPLFIELGSTDGKTTSLKLFEQGGRWLLEAESYDLAFQVPDTWAEKVRGVKLQDLIVSESSDPKPE